MKKFKCVHCGGLFELDYEDQVSYEQGNFIYEPDTCAECQDQNEPDDNYSDADPGL